MDSDLFKKVLDAKAFPPLFEPKPGFITHEDLYRQCIFGEPGASTASTASAPAKSRTEILSDIQKLYEELKALPENPARPQTYSISTPLGKSDIYKRLISDDIKPSPALHPAGLSGITVKADKIRGISPDFMIFDELATTESDMAKQDVEALSAEAQQRLEKLAETMTQFFQESRHSVTLLSPGNLTVSIPGKGFSKVNHIGGEEFTAKRAYLGKRNKLIFVFAPEAASAYTEMEMTEPDALQNLAGFKLLADQAAGTDFYAELQAVRRMESDVREAEQVKEKFDQYEAFGSW